MNRKNKAIMIAILAFSLLYWYFSAFLSTCSAAEVSAVEAPETITISRAQYNELKTIISEQGQRLTEFETKLTAAGAELAGADRDAERAEGIARQNAETIRSCREILERSKAAHQRAEQILAEIERENQTPAEGAAPARNPG